jgi:predicted dehydrogenase
MRIGVIGCGQMALKGALPGLSKPGSDQAADAAPFLRFDGAEDVEIALVADVDRERVVAAAARFGAERVLCGNVTPVLGDFGLEGVVICTPPSATPELATAALEAGVSALVEKPVVNTLTQLETVISVRRLHPELACMVNLVWAYHPAVERARELVAEGIVGAVERVTCVFEHGGPQAWAPDATWYHAAESGGPVSDLGLHVLWVVERVLGGPVVLDGPSSERNVRGHVGTAEAALGVGWDAVSPHFVLELEGTEANLFIKLTPWAAVEDSIRVARHGGGVDRVVVRAAATRGGPYRDFVRTLSSGTDPLAELSYLEAALRSLLVWRESA